MQWWKIRQDTCPHGAYADMGEEDQRPLKKMYDTIVLSITKRSHTALWEPTAGSTNLFTVVREGFPKESWGSFNLKKEWTLHWAKGRCGGGERRGRRERRQEFRAKDTCKSPAAGGHPAPLMGAQKDLGLDPHRGQAMQSPVRHGKEWGVYS